VNEKYYQIPVAKKTNAGAAQCGLSKKQMCRYVFAGHVLCQAILFWKLILFQPQALPGRCEKNLEASL